MFDEYVWQTVLAFKRMFPSDNYHKVVKINVSTYIIQIIDFERFNDLVGSCSLYDDWIAARVCISTNWKFFELSAANPRQCVFTKGSKKMAVTISFVPI